MPRVIVMSLRKRWLDLAAVFLSVVIVLRVPPSFASSRSPSRHHSSTSSRKQRKRKHRHQKDSPDPHDISSSSPSFLPLVFSDDNEREEDILSALARLAIEDEEEEQEKKKEKPTIRKTKGVVKKAMSSSKVERKRKAKEKSNDKVARVTNGNGNGGPDLTRKTAAATESLLPSNVGSSLNGQTQDRVQRSSPREKLASLSSDLPPRPTWKRPQQQPLQSRPPMTPGLHGPMPPSTRGMPGVRTPPSAHSYAPPGAVTSPQTKPQGDVHSSTTHWVRKFLAARPKDTLLPIPREYMSDGFNLVQLAPIVEQIASSESGYVPPSLKSNTDTFPLFKAALRLILSNEDEPTSPPVQRAAEVLYTLVHARYVISPRGLDTVRRVLRRPDGTVGAVFGRCPRIQCRGMPLLPCGDSDNFDPRNSVTTRSKRYCSCCGEKFYMWDSKTDESAWGPSFCHLFLMIYGPAVFPDLHVSRAPTTEGRDSSRSVPTIFGFKVHPVSQLRYSVRES